MKREATITVVGSEKELEHAVLQSYISMSDNPIEYVDSCGDEIAEDVRVIIDYMINSFLSGNVIILGENFKVDEEEAEE